MSLLFVPCIPAAPSPTTHDPYWSSVVMLAHLDTSSGSPRVFPNASPNGSNLVDSSGTNPDVSATQYKFGGFSLVYSSASGNPFCQSANSNYGIAGTSGDITTELWIFLNSVSTEIFFLDHRDSTVVTTGYNLQVNATGVVSYRSNGIDRIISGSNAIAINTWTNIAFCRASGTSRLFVNGSQVGSNFTDSLNLNNTHVTLLNTVNGASARTGCYIDEVRITNAARYTANFTVATAAFPDQ